MIPQSHTGYPIHLDDSFLLDALVQEYSGVFSRMGALSGLAPDEQTEAVKHWVYEHSQGRQGLFADTVLKFQRFTFTLDEQRRIPAMPAHLYECVENFASRTFFDPWARSLLLPPRPQAPKTLDDALDDEACFLLQQMYRFHPPDVWNMFDSLQSDVRCITFLHTLETQRRDWNADRTLNRRQIRRVWTTEFLVRLCGLSYDEALRAWSEDVGQVVDSSYYEDLARVQDLCLQSDMALLIPSAIRDHPQSRAAGGGRRSFFVTLHRTGRPLGSTIPRAQIENAYAAVRRGLNNDWLDIQGEQRRPTAGDVAGRLGVSKRTVMRALRASGLKFSDLHRQWPLIDTF